MQLNKEQLKTIENMVVNTDGATSIAPHTYQFSDGRWKLSVRVGDEIVTIMWRDALGTHRDGEACVSPAEVNKTVSKALQFFGIKD